MAIPGPASLETRCVQSFKKSVSGLTHQSVIDVPHPHASLLGRDGSLGHSRVWLKLTSFQILSSYRFQDDSAAIPTLLSLLLEGWPHDQVDRQHSVSVTQNSGRPH